MQKKGELLTFRVTKEQHGQILDWARRRGVTMSDLFREMFVSPIQRKLAREKKHEGKS